ncbi:MAG: glycosyl hydrolase 108 family protein [Gammaproteobacteria bacterium]|nr:glycosyl hydrolase 108 family protein [Gammaproteobacteria bacterium]
MKNNFKEALKHVLVHEGGWADHPKDPGGATMKGVTLITFRRHFGKDRSKEELRNISDVQLEQIYRSGYWDKCHCDDLPEGVDYVVFDGAVNSGPGRSAKWLQGVIGAKQDGGVGPKTLAKVAEKEPAQMCDLICDRRLAFLQSLRTWKVFGLGWGRRVEGVRKQGLKLAGGFIPSIDYETVKLGSRSVWVENLQQALDLLVDGVFGEDTDAALREWQGNHGLQADGIAGRDTYRALGLIA